VATDIGEAQIELTPEGMDRLRAKLGDTKSGARKLWFRRCDCSCGCPINHPGTKPTCVLCRGNDHWTRIVKLLDAITRRDA
jgi:hypothetical protein